MRVLYFDCSDEMAALYERHCRDLMPDLELHIGDPPAAALAGVLEGCAGALNGHTMMTRELLAACPELKVVVFLGTGAESYIDLAAAADLGVTVRNVAGYGNRTIAEHTIALLFAAARSIARMDRQMRGGQWHPRAAGFELAGKTIGLVGLGNVGRTVAEMASALGMEVIAWNRSGVPDGVPARSVALDDLFREADVVSLHVAVTPETEGLLDARRLGLMQPHCILINAGRGALVDEATLVAALRERRIGHAALDVYQTEPLPPDHPLSSLDNVTLTPHTAWMSPEAATRLLRMSLEIMAEELAAL